MENRILLRTESLCPECLRRIPASYIEKYGKVYMDKECPEHGAYSVPVWSDTESYAAWLKQSVHDTKYDNREPVRRGCPYDCGLCNEHEGRTCTAVLEVTYRCNMNCDICFADTEKNHYEPDLDKIKRMYQAAYKYGGDCSIQLSGGEPTVREDIFDMLRMGKEMGFSHIQVNTNGIKLAADPSYALRLKEAGADLIYLQFDSLRDETYRVIRGRDMASVKFEAIENCRRAELGVMLVPVIIQGVNDREIGDIIRFAKEKMPAVKGVHFQPVSYFGRYPDEGGRLEWGHLNLADIMRALEEQTGGELKVRDMVPRKRYDSHCAFSSAYVLDENNVLRAITSNDQNSAEREDTDFSVKANAYTNKFWRMSHDGKPAQAGRRDMREFLNRLKNYTLSVSGMGFQDVYNIDIGRLRGCCVHIITDDEKAVPLCAFHLTSASGERLYQNG